MDKDPNPQAFVTKQKGFALIVVIWVGVLLALMAAAFSSAVRSRIRTTAARAEIVSAEALADAGVRIALLEILNQRQDSAKSPRFPSDGTTITCAIGRQATLVIQIEDEDGKINLNTSNEDLLVALFTGLGVPRTEARQSVNRIMDFRDIDHDKRADGAERDDYAKVAGLSAGPKDSDFVSVDELDQVLGLLPEIREKAKPFLTTLSSQNGIDPNFAPHGLKSLLVRGASGILATADPGAGDESIFSNGALPPAFAAASSRRGYTIRTEALLPSGARFVSEAVVALPDGAGGAPVFRHWRRGNSRLPIGQPVPAPERLSPC